MLVKRVLNPAKKNHVEGNTFHLIVIGTDAVLYDSLWDEPIIYGNKNLVKIAVTDKNKLTTLIDKNIKEITLFVYKPTSSGEIKKVGDPIKGKPTELKIPNL